MKAIFLLPIVMFCFLASYGISRASSEEYEKQCVAPAAKDLKACIADCEVRDKASKRFDYRSCHNGCLDSNAQKVLDCERNLKKEAPKKQASGGASGREQCLYLIKNLSQSEALHTEYYNAVNCCSYIINIEWDCVGGKRMHDPKSYTIEPNMRGRYDMNCSPGSTLTGKAKRVDKMDAGTRYGYPTSFCEQKKSSDPSDVVKSVEVNK